MSLAAKLAWKIARSVAFGLMVLAGLEILMRFLVGSPTWWMVSYFDGRRPECRQEATAARNLFWERKVVVTQREEGPFCVFYVRPIDVPDFSFLRRSMQDGGPRLIYVKRGTHQVDRIEEPPNWLRAL